MLYSHTIIHDICIYPPTSQSHPQTNSTTNQGPLWRIENKQTCFAESLATLGKIRAYCIDALCHVGFVATAVDNDATIITTTASTPAVAFRASLSTTMTTTTTRKINNSCVLWPTSDGSTSST